MGFRNPITTATDPAARAAAAAAQNTANTANTAAGAALSLAQGKTTTYIATSTPAAPAAGFTVGDQWINPTSGVLSVWRGSTTGWQPQQWGSAALAANAVTAGTIAAGAVDGMTITGATLRTASAGQRVELDGGSAKDRIRWFTGDAGEVQPARTYVQIVPGGASPADRGVLWIAPPELGGTPANEAGMSVYGQSRDGTTPGEVQLFGKVTLNGDVLRVQGVSADPASLTRRDWVLGGWQTLPLAAGMGTLAGAYTPQFRLSRGGWVELRGGVSSAAALTAGTTLGTLAAAYRPTSTVAVLAQGTSDVIGLLQILNTGVVTVKAVRAGASVTSTTWLSLDGIAFDTA